MKSPRVEIILELYEKALAARTRHKDNNSRYHESYHETTTYSLELKKEKEEGSICEGGNGDLISKARANKYAAP